VVLERVWWTAGPCGVCVIVGRGKGGRLKSTDAATCSHTVSGCLGVTICTRCILTEDSSPVGAPVRSGEVRGRLPSPAVLYRTAAAAGALSSASLA
jgi:hypothetical protein